MKATVLITASSKGLGKEIADSFGNRGYELILNGRSSETLESTREEFLKKRYTVVASILGDIRSDEVRNQMVRMATSSNLGILVNNAAVACPGRSIGQLTDEQIREQIDSNLLAPILLTNNLYTIIKQNTGSIININSILSLETKKNRSIHTAAKRGLMGFSECIRKDAFEDQVRVMQIYITRVKTKPEYDFGMDPHQVAEKILNSFLGGIDELLIDGRPEKYRPQKEANPPHENRIYISEQ